MPVIAMTSPKGGAGKTTIALLLASRIALTQPVTLIDADPNRPMKTWLATRKALGLPDLPNLRIDAEADEENILDHIDASIAATPFTVIDLAGQAARIVLLAISQADLVLIPTQGSKFDTDQASRSLRMIRDQERLSGRKVPHAVVLSRTDRPEKRTRLTKDILQQLTESGIPTLRQEVHQRSAFAALTLGKTLEDLRDAKLQHAKEAIKIADALLAEVVEKLMASSQEARPVNAAEVAP